VLIRETARRVGGGWPVMVLLAAAFGMFQAGLVDQSLFNPAYLDDTEFADAAAAADATRVPVLGLSAQQALSYVGNHVALSICAPIAIVESFLNPGRRRRAWLRGPGLAVVGVVYLLGCLLIFSDDGGRKNFLASPVQLTFAAVTVLGLIGAAMLPRWRRTPPPVPSRAPHPIWPGLVVVGAYLTADLVPGWVGVAIQVAVPAAAATTIVVWSRRTGWGQRHVLAAWAAALISAAAGAYVVPNYEPASPAQALLGDIAISVITLALVGTAFWRLRGRNPTPAGPPYDAAATTGPGETTAR
jgi:hypothetical protein